ncbi:hypothetical protein EUGRSUZ_I00947 [Eucalyptus grandis]|uniref:Uncharacterized protein n=2 Tax=Eucalyptus grandis TaxID=71139 RepID=A0ACC3JEC5_EUCGR|nr:hypothetical protein EUGRSUZ_I00947 [Eucalyptus grandis]
MIFHEIVFIYGRPMKPTIADNANSLKENYPITSVKLVSGKIDAGQKIAEKGEVLLRNALAQSLGLDNLGAVYVDDFRPAIPVNSDRHVVTVSRNDFQPAEPGHSPGVGHSFQY